MTEVEPQDNSISLRRDLAIACRVLAHRGLVEDILGHISWRLDDQRVLVRCRGPEESGLRFTQSADIRVVDPQTSSVTDDETGTYKPPSELPIHLAVFNARPDVSCVVHAHPPSVVAASLARLPLVPLFGAYNIPAARLAANGIPTFPRSALIRTRELGVDMVRSLGDAPGVVLTGHGVVTTGTTVQQAVLRALQIDALARMTMHVHSAGAQVRPIPAEDLAELPDLGSTFNETTLWRHHLAALAADGFMLEESR
ncbi:MAG: class II aldolase/adducin family protein [Acidimicrobiales bacterium]